MFGVNLVLLAIVLVIFPVSQQAIADASNQILIKNVRVFDGKSERLSGTQYKIVKPLS